MMETCTRASSTSDGLERDPGLRIPIHQHSSSAEEIIDKYVSIGPFQPRDCTYPVDAISLRKFSSKWFDRYWWLEYSFANDSVYCFPCFLFSSLRGTQNSGGSFVTKGFRKWKHAMEKNKGIVQHNASTDHAASVKAMQGRKDNVLPRMLSTLDAAQKQAHASQLVTSAKVIMHLAVQGLAFRGHDESITSVNRGNFLETRDFLIRDHAELELALANVPQNAKYTSPVIQKDLTRAAADLFRQQIRQELGDGYYCLVVDEARCESKKEWMSVVLWFVDKTGVIREKFAGAVHVEDTKADTLFQHLVAFIHNFGLDMSKLRGQAFDGASNMRGVFNGLQTLVRAKAPFAFYVHCFAHRDTV